VTSPREPEDRAAELLARLRRHAPRAAEWSAAAERRLVDRVLARTTRADPSWRGDVALGWRFLRERLAASSAWRVLAASLVLHLIALPALAFFLVRAPGPGVVLRFEPAPTPELPRPERSPVEPDPPRPAGSLDPSEDGLGERADAARVENALRRARHRLRHAAIPPVPSGFDPARARHPEIALLGARSLGLQEGHGWSGSDELAAAGLEGLARVLWIELALDRYALAGERADALPRELAAVQRAVGADARDGALHALAAAALERARAYGLVPAPRGFDPEAVEPPLGAAWRSLLRHALEGLPAEEGVERDVLAAWRAGAGD